MNIELINDDSGRYYLYNKKQRLTSVHEIMVRTGYMNPVPSLPHIIKAREAGNRAHASLEQWMNARDFMLPSAFGEHEKYIEYVKSEVLRDLGLTPIATEKRVVNLDFEYAGTMDLLCRDYNDQGVIVDYKFTSLYNEAQSVQLELYAKCFEADIDCFVVNPKLKEIRMTEPRHKSIADQIAIAFKEHRAVSLSSEILESKELDYMEAEKAFLQYREDLKDLCRGDNSKAEGRHLTVQRNIKGIISINPIKTKNIAI